eukprot:12085001-Alexandrium_andersonii.AAC.1
MPDLFAPELRVALLPSSWDCGPPEPRIGLPPSSELHCSPVRTSGGVGVCNVRAYSDLLGTSSGLGDDSRRSIATSGSLQRASGLLCGVPF